MEIECLGRTPLQSRGHPWARCLLPFPTSVPKESNPGVLGSSAELQECPDLNEIWRLVLGLPRFVTPVHQELNNYKEGQLCRD
ncbi:hypothetical protein Y1Q_0011977 [Alligator mississippiensis]|uniref:Uncharacterized protein n=1 Tax=Alligator mississippiensis TaxID=8496 RepID=A0A151NGW1_ALLMI|nr:hypothetical protein Y1Q_0011977 [Alligator mississippiensis]